jgi:nucleotide-binding universal stress UspA family protein
MSLRRRSYEPGHSPKFMVVIDDTPECDRALYFASRRALRTGGMPERVIREGEKAEEILKLIEEDEDIALLILAASAGTEGPGPLVASLAKTAGTFPIPVAIVPGHLSDEDLESMS